MILVAQAAYHLEDLVPVRVTLTRHGVESTIVCPLPQPSLLRRWRSSWWRHHELLAAAARAGLSGSRSTTVDELLAAADAVVVRNDWGVTRDLVDSAAEARVPTIGWVEGVQDFTDADTGRNRRPYRHVGHVLTLGEYDRDQLTGTDATIVGSERLWRAWRGPATTGDGPSVVNVNFTYGVFEKARTQWVADVRAAGRASGQRLVISRHPADRGHRYRRAENRTPVDRLLAHAPRLVSRFSTLCYEALLRGVELIYHNPHGEQVATFTEPDGAFRITRSRAELTEALGAPRRSPDEVRLGAESFLRRHLVLDDPSPAERAAARIAELAGAHGR